MGRLSCTFGALRLSATVYPFFSYALACWCRCSFVHHVNDVERHCSMQTCVRLVICLKRILYQLLLLPLSQMIPFDHSKAVMHSAAHTVAVIVTYLTCVVSCPLNVFCLPAFISPRFLFLACQRFFRKGVTAVHACATRQSFCFASCRWRPFC